MRTLRDLALSCALWAFVLLVVQSLLLSDDGVVFAWVGGGVGAGLLVVLERRRWWLVLLPLGVAIAYVFHQIGYEPEAVLARALVDVATVVLFALAIRRAGRHASLGAQTRTMLLGLVAAVALRMLPVWGFALFQGGEAAASFQRYWPVILLATVSGLLAGTSLVVGLRQWRDIAPAGDRRTCGVVAAANVLTLAVLVGWSQSSSEFGGDLLILPMVIWAAASCSVAFNAVLSGVAVTVLAAAAASTTGVYSSLDSASVAQVVHVQLLLVLLVVLPHLLARTIGQRLQAERRAVASLRNLESLFERAPVAAALTVVGDDGRLVVTDVNDGFRATFGVSRPPAGVPLAEVIRSDAEVDPSGRALSTLRAEHADGTAVWVRPSVSLLRGASDADAAVASPGRPAVVVFEDVTAARAFAELQRRQARYDVLTGLVNRELLLEQLDGATTSSEPLGVVMLNVNGMADLNEAIGHPAGDEVLLALADRLRALVGPGHTLSRFGGDVFVFVAPAAGSDAEVEGLAQLLMDAVARPILIGGREVVLSASAGSVFCDVDGRSERDVVRVADAALKEARRRGRGRLVHRHIDAAADSTTARLDVETTLRGALDEHRLECLYQPVVAAGTGELVSVEALARLRDANGTLLPPSMFIPLADEIGLLGRLTDEVLAIACAQAAAWKAQGASIRIAVNVPPDWLVPGSEARVARELASHGLSADALTLEITEDQTLDLQGPGLDVLTRLAGSGIRIAIDDFGSGYAGLAAFRDVPAQVVKIDRGFVTAMLGSRDGHDLVDSMIQLAHRFDRLVVAEGVETDQQSAALVALGCDFLQGYLTGRPMPAADIPLP